MWSILYFAQLAVQYGPFGTLFHIQTNCSHFVEHISLKAGDKKESHTCKNVRELS